MKQADPAPRWVPLQCCAQAELWWRQENKPQREGWGQAPREPPLSSRLPLGPAVPRHEFPALPGDSWGLSRPAPPHPPGTALLPLCGTSSGTHGAFPATDEAPARCLLRSRRGPHSPSPGPALPRSAEPRRPLAQAPPSVWAASRRRCRPGLRVLPAAAEQWDKAWAAESGEGASGRPPTRQPLAGEGRESSLRWPQHSPGRTRTRTRTSQFLLKCSYHSVTISTTCSPGQSHSNTDWPVCRIVSLIDSEERVVYTNSCIKLKYSDLLAGN